MNVGASFGHSLIVHDCEASVRAVRATSMPVTGLAFNAPDFTARLRVMSRGTVLSPCDALCHFVPSSWCFALSECHLMAVDNALCHGVR
jgi:hypothetical protein